MTSCPWVVLRGIGDGLEVVCKRCGVVQPVTTPIGLRAVVAVVEDFTVDHRECREGGH